MKYNISVVGLGYVGLPLAIEFAKYFKVIGYDKNISRIRELKKSYDKNNEIKRNDLLKSKIYFTDKINLIKNSNIFIITLPTPITKNKLPDLRGIIQVTKKIGKILKKGDLVIYESTFYPGTVRKICIPILEKNSKMVINFDFYCGYSPERINPGDNKNKLTNITKVVSGSNSKALSIVNSIYKKIIHKGTHKAQSLEVAEAAKIIENVQRDINIALMNELYFLFHKTNINFYDILKASSTKWNFLNFKPGLVGGHCIGIDPYYLIHKSKSIGYVPKVILQSRNINENMSSYCILRFLKKMKEKKN